MAKGEVCGLGEVKFGVYRNAEPHLELTSRHSNVVVGDY